MSDFLTTQGEIIDKLNTLAATTKFQVFDGAVPTGEDLISERGGYWPYVVFSFGGKTQAANRHRGISSSAEDVKWTAVVFYCVGDTPATVRKLKEVLRAEFEGYVPGPGWGELTEILTGDFGISKPDPDLIPLRYGETLAFNTLVN